MKRFATIVLGGLLGGVVIHVLLVLAYPSFGGRDLWEAMAAYGPDDRFNLLPVAVPGRTPIGDLDPAMAHAVCRLDLDGNAQRISGNPSRDFWSVGVFDARGRGIYSLSSPVAADAALDLLIIRRDALAQLRRDPPEILEEAEIVETSVDQIVVVLRGFVLDDTIRDAVSDGLLATDCNAAFSLAPPVPEPLDEEPAAPPSPETDPLPP